MQSFRDSVPQEFLRRIQKELGWEAGLRLLWPAVVGAQLAANTRLKGLRGSKLLIAVPDRTWRGSLAPLQTMILEAVNRFWQQEVGQAIEFVEDPQMAVPWAESGTRRTRAAKELPPVSLPAGMIADAGLREKFLESAQKYFSWQEEHRR